MRSPTVRCMLRTVFLRPLDPTSRRLRFPRDTEAIITDTVGFLRNLPKELVSAFRATLEELNQADLLVHVIDISNPQFEEQMAACERILSDLDLNDIPSIRVFNKQDRFPDKAILANLCRLHDATVVSALHPQTLLPLVERIETFFVETFDSCYERGQQPRSQQMM